MRLLKEDGGQTSVIFALFMAIVGLGFLAFALDSGSLFRSRRMAQAAADGAALAAAEELSAGYSANQQTVAEAVARLNGFDTSLATNPATVTLSTPGSGNFSGSAYVQVTVSKPIHTVFLSAFSHGSKDITVAATAIAGGSQTSQTCVCLEGSSGQVLNMSNGSQLTASGCGVVANSTSNNAIGVVGGSTLTALSVGAKATNWDTGANINNGGSVSSSHIIQGLSSSCAPTLPTAPTWASCSSDPGGSFGTFTFGPASAASTICYTGLTVGANGSTVTLNPGTYVINGGTLHFMSGSGGHSNLGGNGVFFYLTNGASLSIDNGANVNLVSGGSTQSGGGTAPTVGAYNGTLIYQNSSDTNALSIQGGSSTYMNGALYAPTATLNLGNGSGSTINGGIVASAMNMTGGGTMNITSFQSEGSVSIGGNPKLVQ